MVVCSAALRSRLILVRLRGAVCYDGGSGSDLKSRKTRHIFSPRLFLTYEGFKSSIYKKSLYLSRPQPFFNENCGYGSRLRLCNTGVANNLANRLTDIVFNEASQKRRFINGLFSKSIRYLINFATKHPVFLDI